MQKASIRKPTGAAVTASHNNHQVIPKPCIPRTKEAYRRLRESRGSQVEVAPHLGINLTTLSRRERSGPIKTEMVLALQSIPAVRPMMTVSTPVPQTVGLATTI